MLVINLKRYFSRKSLVVLVVVFLCSFFSITGAFAQGTPIQNGFNDVSNIGEGDIGTANLQDIVINVINIALGFLGVIAVVIIIYGGFLWMTSAGNEQQLERARKTLINATIGLGIILLAWAIAFFVVSVLLDGSRGGGSGQGDSGPGKGALGGGIIENVYPSPGARDVPRNTHIFVTFKESMDVSTIKSPSGFIEGCGSDPVVEIVNEQDGTILDEDGCNTQVTESPDGRTFDFSPPLLGSDTEPTLYTVRLKGGIEKANGDRAFGALSATGIGFDWSFEIGTFIDVIPPYVVGYQPRANSDNPRNVIITIKFSEAINPLSLRPSGIDAIVVNDLTNSALISGSLFLAGDYRTVDFFPESLCEGQVVNTCGEPIFCLPANATIETFITTDPITAGIEGIQDASGNSFDGNKNKIGGEVLPAGPVNIGETPLNTDTGDTAFWIFTTNDTIDIIPPLVTERNPNSLDRDISTKDPLSIKMDKRLAMSTLKPDGSYGDGKEYVTLIDPRRDIGYWITGTNGNGCSALCLNEGSDAVLESVCGNGVIELGEDCDDNNSRSFDGCSSICLNEGTATCGDGLITYREECDIAAEPWSENPGTCDVDTCVLLGTVSCNSISGTNCCGNGVLEPGESCDDTDDSGCTVPSLGTSGGGYCLRTGNAVCGNGVLERDLGEACDDGNSISGDGCSSICLNEGAYCGNGRIDVGEDCDASFGCSADCTHEGNPTVTCGNNSAVSTEGEDCDLGPLSNESYVFINHTPLKGESDYGTRIGSGVRDAFQNCFLPCADHDQGSPFSGSQCARLSFPSSPIGWAEGSPWNTASTDPFPSCVLP